MAARSVTKTFEESSSCRSAARIALSIPHMSGREREFVEEAFRTNWLSTVGPNVVGLEEEFERSVGQPAVALASGTAAIHLGLKVLGVKPGDEVVAPTLTFVATVNPILYEKAVPVLIDSERASWNMDPQRLADFLKKRAEQNRLPKTVVVVHLFGQPADMESILSVCRRYELTVLEDAAESLGATCGDRSVGTLGDVGVYSLNGNKIITGTGGGMLVSGRSEWLAEARFWANQSREPGLEYRHSQVGYNYRMSNVLAGIARGQLGVLPERIEQRRRVGEVYRRAFADIPGLQPMPVGVYGYHTNWLSCVWVDEARFGLPAGRLLELLDAANVEVRSVWKPMHTQPLFRHCECVGGEVAESLNRHGLCLPSSSNLSDSDQAFVIERIRSAHRAAGARGHGAGNGDCVRP